MRCFIGLAQVRNDAAARMKKRWATPRHTVDKGLLLRDKEPDIATTGAEIFASC
jgi:hypothetical protein